MKNDNITAGLLHLEDAICEHERGGPPGYTLILIPIDKAEGIHVSRDGKPVDLAARVALDLALLDRRDGAL